MLNRLISILLIACLSSTLFKVTIPLSWYLSNYTYITTELCINRSNPDVECDGFCQLEKRMGKQHTNHSKNAPPTTERNQRIDFFVTEYSPLLKAPVERNDWFINRYNKAISIWISQPSSPPPQWA